MFNKDRKSVISLFTKTIFYLETLFIYYRNYFWNHKIYIIIILILWGDFFMIVENYDINNNLFEPEKQILDLKYVYIILKKYMSENDY